MSSTSSPHHACLRFRWNVSASKNQTSYLRKKLIEIDPMSAFNGIIFHQTNGPTAQSTLVAYDKKGARGAHFLIDRDGTIFQTASLSKQTMHVGKLKARCVEERRCISPPYNVIAENDREKVKPVPDRYPNNTDSIGIEIVGQAFPLGKKVPDTDKIYEEVNSAQNESLRWLIDALSSRLRISRREVHRHPTVSRKNATEAGAAIW